MQRIVYTLATLALISSAALAQRGDRPGHKMVEVWRDMEVPPAPVLTPEQAMETFAVADGFEVQLVAAEPLVEDPVALTYDADGRLWVVEMRGFMPNVEGSGEDVRNGQVVVLEDEDGDGVMDKSTVFLEELQMPRALCLVKDGVLVAEPPYLWYCRDTDGDLRSDEKEMVLDDYGVQGPVEHTDNGLMRGLDNWIYNAKSTKRLRWRDGEWVVENNFFRGQWGITQDNYGRLYYNNNSNPLYMDLVPASYMTRNPHFDTKAGLNEKVFRSRDVWTSRVNPGINRGYQPHMLREGRLAEWTAASGPAIYRGAQYPEEMVGEGYIPEPSGNMVRRQKIEFKDGTVTGENAYEKKEWLTSLDERFRPVNLYSAPDGTIHLVDMYRGILQHKVYVTTFLRKQILERELDKPVGLGRIYRVVWKGKPVGESPRLSEASPVELVETLSHEDGWWRDMAQQLLVDGEERSVLPQLREKATAGEDHLGRIHALWTLEGLKGLDVDTIYEALTDAHPMVRVQALRLADQLLAEQVDEEEAQARLGLLGPLMELSEDRDINVLRQWVLSLSGLKVPQIEPVLRGVVFRHADDAVIRDGVISGLANRELEFLQRLLADEQWKEAGKYQAVVIENLAEAISREGSPARVERLLRLAAEDESERHWRQLAILDGMIRVAAPKGRKPQPIRYEEQPMGFAKLASMEDAGVEKRVATLNEFVTWGKAAEPPPPPRPLTASEEKLFDQGKLLYQLTCASCHLESGLGEEGKAPPLLDAPLLLGDPAQVVPIVYNGLTGPITVHGRTYDMTMPGLQGFDAEQIAAILTYARRAWGHGAEPIVPETVERIRQELGDREVPWTVEELEQRK